MDRSLGRHTQEVSGSVQCRDRPAGMYPNWLRTPRRHDSAVEIAETGKRTQ